MKPPVITQGIIGGRLTPEEVLSLTKLIRNLLVVDCLKKCVSSSMSYYTDLSTD